MGMKTRLTTLCGIERPIIQGGLAYLARAPLAAAVSEAGGMGQITAATLGTPQALREEIRAVRRLTAKPFAVNFALGHQPIDALLEVALEEQVPAVSLTGGNPAPYAHRIKEARALFLVLTAGVRAAQKAEGLGADIIIAVGAEGGGHLGRDDVGTMVLTRRVVQSVQVPVVASGGIGDGRGLLAAMALGAEGIEMGTRFVATQECQAHLSYKQRLVQTPENQTVVIERSIGRPGRVLSSPYVDKILAQEQQVTQAEDLWPWVAGEKNAAAALNGDWDQGFAWAGQVTGLITDIPTVRQLLDRMEREAVDAWDQLNQNMSTNR
ncbi:MAG: 2-nitropropane dioxygenase [Sulfobacillus thermosulfidooxidans]|nr:MAG: 2-nitropropane dioxygenase [Sulfobacillus thermosulfidooxidans]